MKTKKVVCNELEIKGDLLNPGFSIYLLKITLLNKTYFYIGMTGDPYYPSARSAFHRIAGHLELNKRSTQNRLHRALNKKGIKTNADRKELNIKMYHFPIEGFVEWPHDDMSADTIRNNENSKHYSNYKEVQKKVCSLENAIIIHLNNTAETKCKVLNTTKGKQLGNEKIPFHEIYDKIISICNE